MALAGDKYSMLIRRRPSAATLVAIVTTLAIGSQTGFAAGSSQSGRGAPDAVSSVEVTATDSSSVTFAWPASRETDVVGYSVYLNGARVGTQTPDQVKRWRDRDSLSYTLRQLACGTGYTVGVDAFDRGDRHSPVTSTTVSTSACPDATPPSAPTGVRQVATTESSVMLAWSPSADNVGVVEYGLYASSLRVATASEASATLTNLACGTSYLIAIDAADAAGNRSAQATSYLRTSPCPSGNQAAPAAAAAAPAPASPTGTGTVRQTIANGSTVANLVNWRAVYDKNGDGTEDDPGSIQFLVDGNQVLSEINPPFGDTFANGTSPSATASTPSRCAHSTTAAPCSPPTRHRHHRHRTHPHRHRPELDGCGDADDRERVDGGESRQLACGVRQERRRHRGRPRLDPVPRRRQPGAVRDQPTVWRHLRQRDDHRQQRPAHLPGARTQRQRHPARHQHDHRHHRHRHTPHRHRPVRRVR